MMSAIHALCLAIASAATAQAGAPVMQTAPALLSEEITIDGQWRQYDGRGVTARDYGANELVVSLHLATGKQTIAINPVFVLVAAP